MILERVILLSCLVSGLGCSGSSKELSVIVIDDYQVSCNPETEFECAPIYVGTVEPGQLSLPERIDQQKLRPFL